MESNWLEYKCLVVLEGLVLLLLLDFASVFSREAQGLRDHEETGEKRAIL